MSAGDHNLCLEDFYTHDKASHLVRICDESQLQQLKGKNEFTLLHLAAKKGWLDIVNILIEQYEFDVTVTDIKGYTPLHVACAFGKMTIVKRLLREENCHVKCRTNIGRTPLHISCFNGRLEVVKYLIAEFQCDSMCKTNNGETPLHSACSNGLLNFEKMLHANADACSNSTLNVIKYLITECKCNPMSKDNDGRTPLHIACCNSSLDVIKYLTTECEWDPMCTTNNGETPLHIAFSKEKHNVAEYLISSCCNCNPMSKTNNSKTQLQRRCYFSSFNAVKYLIKKGYINPKQTTNAGQTPLHCACYNGSIDGVKYLVTECKCDPMCAANNDGSPLHYACSSGSLDVVKYLTKEHKCDPTKCTTNDGRTPLHSACYNGSLDVVKYLITECHIDPMCTSNNGETPLHIASYFNSVDVVKYLVTEHHINPMSTTNYGRTPLHHACYNGSLDVVKYLLTKCRIDSMYKTNDGETPLHSACYNDSLEVVKYLISYHKREPPLHSASNIGLLAVVKYLITKCDCNPLCTDCNGETVLHKASKGSLDVVKYLIVECNMYPMCKTNDGSTPLHFACSNGSFDVVKYLVTEHKCDPKCTTNNGITPLHKACSNGSIECVKYLVAECKCDSMSTDNSGKTPLHYACFNGSTECVKYLVAECKCDPFYKTGEQTPPFYTAFNNSHVDIVEYILCESFSNPSLCKLSFIKSNRQASLVPKLSKLKECASVNSFVNVFLLGESGAGKTTLTEVIKKHGVFTFGNKIRNVDLNTAGIVPHVLKHKELGNIILHDLAGQPQYYSSHSAVLEDILEGSEAAVFIIVTKLSDDPPYSWLNLVKDLSSKCSSNCYLATVASHADAVDESRRVRLAESLDNGIQQHCKEVSNLKLSHQCYLDCRKLKSEQFTFFINHLSQVCESLRRKKVTTKIDSKDLMYCSMLYLLLDSAKEDVYSFTEVVELVNGSNDDHYLPETEEKLFETLHYLHQIGLIMFLRTPKGSWVVTDKKSLLSEVNRKIFALESSSNAGVVSYEKLCHVLSKDNSTMLVEFLIAMKLCERITPEMMKSTNLTAMDDSGTELLFFPALMTYKQRPKMCGSVDGAAIKKPFQFGWCLQCTNKHQFFNTRFLHLLILRLAYQYAFMKEQDNPHHLKHCTIWSTGILWSSGYGVTTLVELVDSWRCVILLMYSHEELEHNMIPVRRAVITDIVSIQQENCPSLQPKEFVVDPSELHYPIDEPLSLTLYDIKMIATAVYGKQPVVLPSTNKSHHDGLKLKKLLPMEYDRGQDISLFLYRDLESLKLPGGHKLPNTITSSPVEVLKKYNVSIQDLVTDPGRLATQLHSGKLISDGLLDRVLTTLGLSRSDKASLIMNELIQHSMAGGDEVQKFKTFCKILKKDATDLMKENVTKMEKEVGPASMST